MAPTDVEITISSAHDLKNVNWKLGDLCAYAVAWIDEGLQPIKVTTRVDASGDTSPSWGQKFVLSVSKEKLEDSRLLIEIFHDKAEDPEKAIVGRASLALLEVVDAGGYDELQDYSLKLKRPSGRPHGKIKIAVRLRERRGAYSGLDAPPAAYGQSYYNPHEGGQSTRDWQSSYPGYSSPYPPQPYPQSYPTQPYPSNYSYGGTPSYGAPPPQSYGSYGAPPPQPYGAPTTNYYSQSPPPSNYQEPAARKSSKFGGIGTGLAVGALAGGVGALALGEYIDHKEDEAAEEQAEEDAQLYATRDDDYGGGDDDGDGDDY